MNLDGLTPDGFDLDKLMGMLGDAKDTIPEAGELLNIFGKLGEQGEEADLENIVGELSGILSGMQEKYGALTITDDEGNDHDFTLLDQIEEDGKTYLVAFDNEEAIDEDEQATVYILESTGSEDSGEISFVEDEAVYNRIFDIFESRQAENID